MKKISKISISILCLGLMATALASCGRPEVKPDDVVGYGEATPMRTGDDIVLTEEELGNIIDGLSIEMTNGSTGGTVDNNYQGLTEGQRFKQEYESVNADPTAVQVSLTEEPNVHYMSESELISFLESGTGVLYFGYPTCPWCRTIIPHLTMQTQAYGLTVNYFNPQDIRDQEGNATYQFILDKLSAYLDTDENNNPRVYVPDVFFLKDGAVIGHNLGTVESQETAETPLNDAQVYELQITYDNLITQMLYQ